jgi:hypothetical protein
VSTSRIHCGRPTSSFRCSQKSKKSSLTSCNGIRYVSKEVGLRVFYFCLALQILRVNWARIALLSQFMRSTTAMAPALGLSILPLIDSIVSELQSEPLELFELQFEVEMDEFVPGVSRLPEAWRRRLIEVRHFTATRYFQRHTNDGASVTSSAAMTAPTAALLASASTKRKRNSK